MKTSIGRKCRFLVYRSWSQRFLSSSTDAYTTILMSSSSLGSTNISGSSTGSVTNNSSSTSSSSYSISFPRIGVQTAKYSTNLSKLAMDGKLDPVLGRDDELNRAIQILSRRTKNNPCFIGEPGVGKTALAEELARKIWYGEVPDFFKNKVILALDLPSMLAGTKFRGEFEERFKGVLKEIETCGDRIILFIDELHIIAGAGGSEGAIDASNILKPSLSRGQLRCMGATTTDEYRKYIEKDAALARRFQPIYIPEPSEMITKDILIGLREKFELFHNIIISDEAVQSAITLSGKYITDRRYPDKAIDLMDEAASRLKIDLDSLPISSSSSNLHKSNGEMMEIWTNYKNRLRNIFTIRSQISDLKLERTQCQRNGNHDRVLFITDVELKEKNTMLKDLEEQFQKSIMEINHVFKESELIKMRGQNPHILQGIDIATVITKQTGIPVGSLLASEKQSLLNMEVELGKRVIGQDEAIQAISKCIRLSRAGLRYHDRPLGVFLMIGGTGTGKTEIAKSLSEYLFHDSNATHMLRIDMSEYMEKFSVSRLIGAPPGYVGYDEGGALTESVRRRPYQVILLDEFEKAHREVSNLLLQVFDEGRLSDSQGRVIDFRNTVIIMTSNLNSKQLIDIVDKDIKITTARKMVSEYFAPEFVNRVDDIIVFNPLSEEAINRICNIQLSKVHTLLKDKGILIEFTKDVIDWISKTGFDPAYGARPLKRLIQSKILNPLATIMLEDKVKSGETFLVDMERKNNSSTSFSDTSDSSSNENSNDNSNNIKIINNDEIKILWSELVESDVHIRFLLK